MSSISLTGSPLATSLTPNRDTMPKEQQESVSSRLSAVQPVAQVVAAEPDRAQLQQAVDVVNQALLLEKRALNFSIDEDSGRSVIKVFDFKTDELIKQIPSEELLRVAQDIKRLQEEMGQSIGLLIDNRV
ncbi:MAG: flagellar protein FlaG [Alishewanella aestuarii]